VIYTAQGEPAAPELEARVKALDPSLGLRWCYGFWAVTFRWPESDTRRQMIRAGQMRAEDAFDMLAQLPKDCPPEQAADYITRACKVWVIEGRSDVERLLSHIHEANAKAVANLTAPVLDYAEELVDANASTLWKDQPGLEHKNRIRVFQTEPKSDKGTKRVKYNRNADQKPGE
jgi:hypothetical protein